MEKLELARTKYQGSNSAVVPVFCSVGNNHHERPRPSALPLENSVRTMNKDFGTRLESKKLEQAPDFQSPPILNRIPARKFVPSAGYPTTS